ncbi:MAG: hypothetical protein HZA00_05010 [Nitrospinae bacterium]|nr:hypothetical protein [Nitrospinota bacterium]
MKQNRIEFTDRQKADIFKRDRGICCFSGKSLWILDYGACPTFDIDWVDHIKPANKGGTACLENGICSSYFYNYKKRDNSADKQYLFEEGKPTPHFYYFYEAIPKDIARNLHRFKNLHYSDWHFNRSLFRLMLATIFMFDPYSISGNIRSRDDNYYAKSSFKILEEWKKIITSEEVPSFESRSLLPSNISDDQKLMLDIVYARSSGDVRKTAKKLLPYYRDNFKAIELFIKSQTEKEANKVLMKIGNFKFVTPRVITFIISNIERLFKIR